VPRPVRILTGFERTWMTASDHEIISARVGYRVGLLLQQKIPVAREILESLSNNPPRAEP
jgi:hypothetical protein